MSKELECRKSLSPRIIEGDLDEALTDSDGDDKQDPNNESSTEHMKMNINLPKTGQKKTNGCSSFCQQGGRKPKVRNFISPLDTENFKVGCNDDLLSTTSTLTEDDGTIEREKQRAATNWMLKQSREARPLCALWITNSKGFLCQCKSNG